jgi:bifunctional polynucleotide phosphatase/kinase
MLFLEGDDKATWCCLNYIKSDMVYYIFFIFIIVIIMTPRIQKIGKFRVRQKMAIFDYDWTLVKPISNGTFSKNVDDWMWLTEKVQEILVNFYSNGYCIAIVSNQTRNTEMKIVQINKALSSLAIPSIFIVGYEEEFKKPNPAMFDILTQDKKVDFDKTFYVGDALGRQ